MKRICNIIANIIFCCLPLMFFGQTDVNRISYFNWFDDVMGVNNIGLYNGKQYIDVYVNKTFNNHHPFFLTNKLSNGSVIYNEQNYYDIKLRYNVLDDELIIGLESDRGNRVLKLIKENIDQFVIEGLVFLNINGLDERGKAVSGFYQLLLQKNTLTLFKKHEKFEKERIVTDQLYYDFIEKTKYVVFNGDHYINFKSKKDIINVFPEYKKDIKEYYKTNKTLYKSNTDVFMVRLLDKLTLDVDDEL